MGAIPNVDKYGHCVLCHKNMIIERVVDYKVVNMFSPEYEQTEFLLDDGSRMKVAVCKTCKRDTDFSGIETQENIMKAVVAGWELEVKGLIADEKRPEWTEESGRKYLDKYGSKKILYHSENMTHGAVESVKGRVRDKEELIRNHK